MIFATGLLLVALTTVGPVAPVVEAAPLAVEQVPVFLHVDAPDAVGATCVAKFRAALQGSGAYRTVTSPADARFVVGIVTIDPNEAEEGSVAGRSTVAAVTLQRENAAGLNHFVYSWVVVARPDKLDAIVSELVEAVDREIRDVEQTAPQPARVTTKL